MMRKDFTEPLRVDAWITARFLKITGKELDSLESDLRACARSHDCSHWNMWDNVKLNDDHETYNGVLTFYFNEDIQYADDIGNDICGTFWAYNARFVTVEKSRD